MDEWDVLEHAKPFKYEYVCPTTEGYRKVNLSAEDHNKHFPAYPLKWYHKFEYYESDKAIKFERFMSWPAVAISWILFPISLMSYGLSNFKETWIDHVKLLNQKKYGVFISQTRWYKNG